MQVVADCDEVVEDLLHSSHHTLVGAPLHEMTAHHLNNHTDSEDQPLSLSHLAHGQSHHHRIVHHVVLLVVLVLVVVVVDLLDLLHTVPHHTPSYDLPCHPQEVEDTFPVVGDLCNHYIMSE